VAGDDARFFSHYPGLFLLLPNIFQWGKLILGIVFEGLAAGLTAALFFGFFSSGIKKETKAGFAFSKWPHLLLAWTFITAILVLLNWILPQVFQSYLEGSPRRIAIFDIIFRLLTVFIYSIFIYAVPAIVVYGKSVWKSIKTSIGFFAKYPIFSFFLALIPYLISVPTSYLVTRSDIIVNKFSPELVFYLLLLGIGADLLVNFFTTGAVVKFLIDESE
jgi:hypothetical protein